MSDRQPDLQPSRRHALKGLVAGGAIGWVAPTVFSVSAASAQTGPPPVPNYLQANQTTSFVAPLGPVSFPTVQLASGITITIVSDIVIPAAAVYRVTYGLQVTSVAATAFSLYQNGSPAGFDLEFASANTIEVSDNLVFCNAADTLRVVNQGAAPRTIVRGWIIVTQVA